MGGEPDPLADPVFEREIRRIAASTGHALRIAPGALAAFDGIATAMASGLERLDVCVELGAGEASAPELLFEGTARDVGLRFSEGVNVAIAAALAGPGLDATQVRVMRPPRGTIGRTMGFTVRSRAGVFELTAGRASFPPRTSTPSRPAWSRCCAARRPASWSADADRTLLNCAREGTPP